MGLSTHTYTYTGGSQTFSASFADDYIEPEHVRAYRLGDVDGLGEQVYLNFTWLNESEIEVLDALNTGDEIVVERTVPKDMQLVDLSAPGALTRESISRLVRQALHITHEVYDGRLDEDLVDTLDGLVEDVAEGAAVSAALQEALQLIEVSTDNVYPEHYGFNDEVSDITAIVQAAVDDLGEGGTLHFRPGRTYVMNGTVTIGHDNFTLQLGSARIDASNITLNLVQGVPDAPFKVGGSGVRASSTLAADADQYAETITVVDATGMQVGDPLWMESDNELWYTESVNAVTRQVVNRIAGISGNVITLAWPLKLSFTTTDSTVVVESWDCVKNFRCRGGHFIGGGERNNPIGNGVGAGALYLNYIDGADIEVGHIEGFQNVAIRPDKFMDVHIHGGSIRGLQEDAPTPVEGQNSGFYGVFFNDGHGGSFTDCTGHRLRHMQDAGSAEGILLQNLHSYRSHRPAFGSHSGADKFVFNSCFDNDSKGGIQWRGFDVTVMNCVLQPYKGASSGFYDTVGGSLDLKKTYIFSGNRIIANRFAVYLASTIASVTLTNNVLENTDTTASYAPVNVESQYIEYFSMTGGTVAANGANYAVAFPNNTPTVRDFIRIEDVRLSGYSSNPVRIYGAPGTSAIVRNNFIDGADGIAVNSVTATRIIGPNYHTGGQVGGSTTAWTPVLTDGTNNATLSADNTYVSYVGDIATITGRISVASTGSMSGGVKITGLPFTSANQSNGFSVGPIIAFSANTGDAIYGRVSPNSTEIELLTLDGAGGVSAMQASDLGTGTFNINLSYPIA